MKLDPGDRCTAEMACLQRSGQTIAKKKKKKKQLQLTNFKFLKPQFLICAHLLILWSSYTALALGPSGPGGSSSDSPPRITIQPNDLVAIEGESAELNCDAEGQPEPSIEWYHNGQLIKASTHSRTTMGGSIQFLDIRPAAPSSSPLASRPSDTGVYYCLARNSLGQARSRNATLQVAYIKPEFRVAPKDKLASIGDTVTFECLPQAWPEPRIRWRRNGQLIEANEARLPDGSAKYTINKIARADLNLPPDNSLTSGQSGAQIEHQSLSNGDRQQLIDLIGSQLVIKQVDKNDDGRYSCLVETKGSHRLIENESPSAQLSALVKPFFIEAPEHKTVLVGGQVKLRCRIDGDPEPVISWRKQNGQPLSEKTQIDHLDKTLIIDQLTIADQGTYVCEGENSVGSARAVATVTVNSRPKFTVQPEDQEVELGSRVQLRCAGEASPQPMLFWYKEGHRQLMFAPSTTSSTLPTLSQTSKPAPMTWPQTAPLVAPDHRFNSMSASDTSPSINNLFTMPINPDQLTPTNFRNDYFGNRIYVDNQGTLNIINITSSDNGYYACALISSVGSVMAKAKVTIKRNNTPSSATDYLSQVNSQDPLLGRTVSSFTSPSKFELLPPPVIKFGSVNQTLPTNTSTTLVCEVVSLVAYRIQWLFEGQPIQKDPPRVIESDTGALVINELRISDSGVYTCVATAAEDQIMPLAAPFEPLDSSMLTSAPPIQQSTSHSTMLKVASPMVSNLKFYRMDTFAYPSSPGRATFISTRDNDAIAIAWTPPADSGTLPIKEYVIEHYDTSQEHIGWIEIYRIKAKESLLVAGLSSEGSHYFVIRAAHGRGTGPSSDISDPMRTVAGEIRYQAERQRRLALSDSKRLGLDQSLASNIRESNNLARERLMTISTNLLNLTPVSSTSIKLQWSTQAAGNLSGEQLSGINFTPDINDYLDGYSIRYRATGMGESLLAKDLLLSANLNLWPIRENNAPSSLPLVTSYIEEEAQVRNKRDLMNYIDYSQEFNEIRVVDHNTEHYTVNGLVPFTMYQFFVVPYYKEIDGVPSNILSAQTNEDRPSVAPPNLTIRPINSTAVHLLWLHIPPEYANGILRGYMAQINRSDIPTVISNNGQQPERQAPLEMETRKIIKFPLASLSAAPAPQSDPRSGAPQQYIVMHDLTNLTYKSFYSIQIAAFTNVGPGPWSDPQNFIMDPQILTPLKDSGNNFDDVLSKSLITGSPRVVGDSESSYTYGLLGGLSHSSYSLLIGFASLIIITILLVSGYLLYQKNNQRVITWKKTISEHFNNKFYMPSTVDSRGPGSAQHNIYDHQQHLIYSGAPPLAQSTMPAQIMWARIDDNVCVNSNTGSLSSHGGLVQINNGPKSIGRRTNGEQMLLKNKDLNKRFVKDNPAHLIKQASNESSRSQVIHHGDYYSVINMGEYEELDTQQRVNMQLMTNADRHQTASSNSDTSCPSSVTRLLPNQNYNRDINKTFGENQRHEMILQQQIGCNDGKHPFASMINSEQSRLQSIVPLSPYATTNLMNQASMPQQIFANPQMSLVDHSRHQNFIVHNGGITLDDSSKALTSHQQNNGTHNQINVFRTLQRNPINNFQSRTQQFSQAQPQMFMHSDSNGTRSHKQNFNQNSPYQASQVVTNITPNPMTDLKPNLYERIEYSDPTQQNQQPSQVQQKYHQLNSQTSNDIISSSTSSGSMKSSQQHSPEQQVGNSIKFRRGSAQTNFEHESHDLRVFSSQQPDSRHLDSVADERQRLFDA